MPEALTVNVALIRSSAVMESTCLLVIKPLTVMLKVLGAGKATTKALSVLDTASALSAFHAAVVKLHWNEISPGSSNPAMKVWVWLVVVRLLV